ncbi:hypothetical protein PYCCODRAFT_1425160 [Trametes coccinea BRFM310]|uniref:Uncharacterized protein n=1 Tax=Trametes coccinea (strain BRFM310) TaxID=1353009 RepID=A0A1Y2IN90_TRAC3|nr:hypothetical protein PYCCODRAFT_1425160 [Trametes coccinea BRFM310]
MLQSHLPLFANLIRLECHACVFPDERYMFEIVWTCCNPVQLKISNSTFKERIFRDAESAKRLSRIRERRNACQKLSALLLYETHIFIPLNAFLGTALGTTITVVEAYQGLHAIETVPLWHKINQELSTLQMLIENIGHHEALRKIVVTNTGHLAALSPGETPEDMWLGRTFPPKEDPDKPLISVFPNLQELRIVFKDTTPAAPGVTLERLRERVPSAHDIVTLEIV